MQEIKQKVEKSGVMELKEQFRDKRDNLIERKLITITKFQEFVISEEPNFDTEDGKKKIYNVYYGRSSSLNLFMFLEAYEKNHLN